MDKRIIDIIEKKSKELPEKEIFIDTKRKVTYKEFVNNAKAIGTYIYNKTDITNKPVLIFIDKTVNCLETMIGTLYSGNFYTILDVKSPPNRIEAIIENLNASIIITDQKNQKKLEALELSVENVFIYEEMTQTEIDNNKLEKINNNKIDTDTMYILYTSGSTGIPKGVVVSNKAVLSYIKWVKEAFNIDENTVWGSQTPFYFSMSIQCLQVLQCI